MATAKSLSEQVNEVLNGKGNNTYKKVQLEQLGLSKGEVDNLIFIYKMQERANGIERVVRTPRAPRTPSLVSLIKKLTFGVEIECVGASRQNLVNCARNEGVEMRSEGYNHVDNKNYFKIVSDSSISGVDPNEVVSPILEGGKSGFDKLQKCCTALNNAGATANSSCGLHVHIGGDMIDNTTYVNVFKNYQKLEVLIDSFMAQSRRGNCRWAHSLLRYDFSYCTNQRDVCNLLNSRYFKVNPVAWSSHKTIEFRTHQGSTNYEKISMWANFCLKLVVWSAKNVLTETITDINKVPFLSKAEKDYFKARIEHFASVA